MKTFYSKLIKGLALALIIAAALASVFTGCEFREEKKDDLPEEVEYFTKTLGNPALVEYNSLDYIKAPDFKTLKIYKKQLDARVAYSLADVVLQGAEFDTFKDADSATVQLFDTANIIFTGRAKDESLKLSDETIAGMDNSTSGGSDLIIGSFSFIGEYFEGKGNPNKGFEDQLVGMKVGETKDITVTFPDEYQSTELQGVEVIFTVKINSIKRAKLESFIPSDEQCDKYTGGEYKTKAALEEYFYNYYKGDAAYNVIYPAISLEGECKELVDIYLDMYIHEYVVYTKGEQITQQEYDSAYAEAYDSMYDTAHDAAAEEAKAYMITNYLFERFEITLSEEEFDERVREIWEANESYYMYYGISSIEAFVEYFSRQTLEISFKNEMLLEVIGDSVTVVE